MKSLLLLLCLCITPTISMAYSISAIKSDIDNLIKNEEEGFLLMSNRDSYIREIEEITQTGEGDAYFVIQEFTNKMLIKIATDLKEKLNLTEAHQLINKDVSLLTYISLGSLQSLSNEEINSSVFVDSFFSFILTKDILLPSKMHIDEVQDINLTGESDGYFVAQELVNKALIKLANVIENELGIKNINQSINKEVSKEQYLKIQKKLMTPTLFKITITQNKN